MKKLTSIVLALVCTFLWQTVFAQEMESYTKVANQLVELFNAENFAGVQGLFNPDMNKALPLKKATDFFTGMKGQFGKIQKLEEPKASAGWMVFPAQFERGVMDLSLVLDRENKIAGLNFKPRTAAPAVVATTADETESYTKVANELVGFINAGDYAGVESLFDSGMKKALPLEKATELFTRLIGQAGKIEKLDAPRSNAVDKVFPVHFERAELDMSMVLDGDKKISGLHFKPRAAGADVAPKNLLTELSLPFKGKWVVFWGGDTKELNYHHDVPAQNYAFDFLGVDDNGKTHRGDGTKNEDYFCFGREILAPADGVVVEAIDGVRDNRPGSMNPYCLVGNCVVIQHRTNEFSVLAHFQRGTVAVKAGDQVKRGQMLGKSGNSGNSSEPHLHYHVQHSPIFQEALGIKTFFPKVSVTKDGKTETKTNYSPVKGDVISAGE